MNFPMYDSADLLGGTSVTVHQHTARCNAAPIPTYSSVLQFLKSELRDRNIEALDLPPGNYHVNQLKDVIKENFRRLAVADPRFFSPPPRSLMPQVPPTAWKPPMAMPRGIQPTNNSMARTGTPGEDVRAPRTSGGGLALNNEMLRTMSPGAIWLKKVPDPTSIPTPAADPDLMLMDTPEPGRDSPESYTPGPDDIEKAIQETLKLF